MFQQNQRTTQPCDPSAKMAMLAERISFRPQPLCIIHGTNRNPMRHGQKLIHIPGKLRTVFGAVGCHGNCAILFPNSGAGNQRLRRPMPGGSSRKASHQAKAQKTDSGGGQKAHLAFFKPFHLSQV